MALRLTQVDLHPGNMVGAFASTKRGAARDTDAPNRGERVPFFHWRSRHVEPPSTWQISKFGLPSEANLVLTKGTLIAVRRKGCPVPAPSMRSRQQRRQLFRDGRRCVVPLVAVDRRLLQDETPTDPKKTYFLGTATLIEPFGHGVTAAHVLQVYFDYAKSLKNQRPEHEPALLLTVPFAPDAAPDVPVFQYAPIKRVTTGAAGLDVAAFTFVPPSDFDQTAVATMHVDPDPCHDGDEIFLCGYPFGETLKDEFGDQFWNPNFCSGIVSAALPYPEAPLERRYYFRLNTMANQGNSGGPVIDAESGRCVGILTHIFDPFRNRTPAGAPPRDTNGGNESPNAKSGADPRAAPDAEYEFTMATGIARATYAHWIPQVIKRLER